MFYINDCTLCYDSTVTAIQNRSLQDRCEAPGPGWQQVLSRDPPPLYLAN